MNISACVPNRAYYYSLRYKSLNMIRTVASLRSIAFVLALGIIIPILLIFASFLQSEPKIWQHIVDTLLVDLLKNTLKLCIGVLAGTFVLGVGAAWLTAVCDFPGRKFFNWALILPLAVPTYVLAFVFIGLLDFSGPVQALLRANIVSSLKWFPNIRSPGGVIVVMSLALYPYVYLLTRNAFKTQGKRVLEVSQALGRSRAKAFFKAALPMARPWIASGLMLVLMETLADFGAVSIFNYDTFTTGIYKAWFGFFSLSAAGQLSSVLLIFVFVVIIVEQQMRTKIQFNQVGKMTTGESRIRLNGWGKWIAFGFLSAILLIAFFIPCLQLLIWFVRSISAELDSRYIGLLFRSILFSSIAAAVIVGLGLFLAYIQRQYSDFTSKWIIRLATMGYALPGTVLAVGVVIMLSFADRQIIWLIKETSGIQLYSILNGTIVAVIFAYTVRFLTAGFNSINSSMLRITRSQDEASTLLGITGLNQLRKIHIPILKNGLFTAAMLVFVDVMKEMPITLMTRPFGWDTLAVKIFELTSEGEWQRAALPSITLVLAGLVPLILLNRQSERTTL
ncbi:MAG: iron ABC transporter permease [Desulfobacterales bacterium]|nr:MAG: iron ABC transporter permease [Desulfobacterales bacterium]